MTRRLLVLALVVVPILVAPATASALGAPERHALRLVNAAREHRGLHPVHVRSRVSRYAERHSRAMARKRQLFHSSLSISGFSALGECVGVGDTVYAVHRAFLRSSTHRRIILGGWRYVGVGIASRGGKRYVTLDFAR